CCWPRASHCGSLTATTGFARATTSMRRPGCRAGWPPARPTADRLADAEEEAAPDGPRPARQTPAREARSTAGARRGPAERRRARATAARHRAVRAARISEEEVRN